MTVDKQQLYQLRQRQQTEKMVVIKNNDLQGLSLEQSLKLSFLTA